MEVAQKRPYTVSKAALQQRRAAAVKHGLYAAPSGRAADALKTERAEASDDAPKKRRITPWQKRRNRVRHRVQTLIAQFPQLADKPLTLIEALAETELAKGALFNLTVDGVEGAAASYGRACSMWAKIASRLGVLPPDDPNERDSLAELLA